MLLPAESQHNFHSPSLTIDLPVSKLFLLFFLGVAEIILQTQANITLKCIAAKMVKAYHLTYQGQVPKALESFIELHGSEVMQG